MRNTKRLNLIIISLLSLSSTALLDAAPTDPREVNPVEVGSSLPEVMLTEASGKSVSLSEALSGQKGIVIFYRGSWCPYCTRHLAAVGQHEDRLLKNGYRIIAISPDKAEVIQEYMKDADFNYTIYSDSGMAAASAFGLTFKVDSPTLKKLDSYNIDIEAASGQDHHLLPVPAVFITDDKGRITFRHYDPDYKQRLSPEALLKAIQ